MSEEAAPAQPQPSRRRLGFRIVAGALAGLLGFGIVAATRPSTPEQNLAGARGSDLVQLLDDLDQRQQRLEQQRLDLQEAEQRLRSADDATRQQEIERRAEKLAVLAGTVPASGSGITMTITDPARQLSSTVILDAVQELRNAGAYAMSIGDVRVVAQTWFADGAEPGTVVVAGTTLHPPYVLRVLGDPGTLATAMRIPGGVAENVGAVGGRVVIVDDRPVTVTAVRPLSTPSYAVPAPTPS